MTAGGRPAGNLIQAADYPSCSAGRLYAAANQAVSELGFTLTARDDASMTLGFRPASPSRSWPYEQMTAVVTAEGSGARIVLWGAPVGGGAMQMGQWREGHAIAMMILDRLKSVVPQVPEPPAETSSPVSPADRLATLTDLRDRGLLTDAEFDAEKRRMLDT